MGDGCLRADPEAETAEGQDGVPREIGSFAEGFRDSQFFESPTRGPSETLLRQSLEVGSGGAPRHDAPVHSERELLSGRARQAGASGELHRDARRHTGTPRSVNPWPRTKWRGPDSGQDRRRMRQIVAVSVVERDGHGVPRNATDVIRSTRSSTQGR